MMFTENSVNFIEIVPRFKSVTEDYCKNEVSILQTPKLPNLAIAAEFQVLAVKQTKKLRLSHKLPLKTNYGLAAANDCYSCKL
jgi:hypothetical protein